MGLEGMDLVLESINEETNLLTNFLKLNFYSERTLLFFWGILISGL